MTAKIDGTTGTTPAYDIETGVNQGAAPAPAPNTAADEQTEQTPDTAGAAAKRLESGLESNYMRDQLDKAQHRPGVILYDNHANDPGAKANETKAAASASVVGMKLGTGKSGQDVQIKKEIGAPEGYDDERQAIAVARMAGTEPAAVVKINDKWHAVETNGDPTFADGTREHAEGNTVVLGLPPYSEAEKLGGEIATSRKRLEAENNIERYSNIVNHPPDDAIIEKNRKYLKTGDLGEADKAKLRDTLPENREEIKNKLKALQQQYPTRLSGDDKKQLTEKLAADRQKMAGLLFGLPSSQIQFNTSTSNDDPSKMINIDPMNPSQTGDILGREHYPRDHEFQAGLKPTFGIKLEELENPKEAAGVLFHETSHLKDDELAQKWVDQYQKSGHNFVSLPKAGLEPFRDWMNKQVGKQPPTPPLTQADAEIVVNKAFNDTATSEARAYVHTAIAALQSGDPKEAINQLKTYASALKDGRAASPARGSAVEAALTKELQDLYRQHPELRTQIQDAINAAKSANKDAWFSQINLSK